MIFLSIWDFFSQLFSGAFFDEHAEADLDQKHQDRLPEGGMGNRIYQHIRLFGFLVGWQAVNDVSDSGFFEGVLGTTRLEKKKTVSWENHHRSSSGTLEVLLYAMVIRLEHAWLFLHGPP